MRKILIAFIAAILMLAAKNAIPAPRIYTRVGTVYGLEFNKGIVTVQTDDGELWEFVNGPTTEDWMIDDGVLLTFADTGVAGWKYDDEIWGYRYWNPEGR